VPPLPHLKRNRFLGSLVELTSVTDLLLKVNLNFLDIRSNAPEISNIYNILRKAGSLIFL
jgi:hypothetical protein